MAGAAVAVGVAAFLAYGGGFPNTDAMWTLVWGRELLHLDTPSWSAGATPHPLTNLLGVVAALVPSASETVLLAVGYLAVGALVVGVFAVGRALFGVAAGVLAALLVFTRDTLLFYGALAYLDVIFAALVIWAIALEAARPRRGVPCSCCWRSPGWYGRRRGCCPPRTGCTPGRRTGARRCSSSPRRCCGRGSTSW